MRSKKKPFVQSLISLLLCISMLVGTTFAWFTDSVSSAGNLIKAGDLSIGMEWADGTLDPVTAEWQDASQGSIFNYELWEPGYTEVRHIKIENEGSLALKYQLRIIANGEVSKLADVIDVYCIQPAAQIVQRTQLTESVKLGTLTEVLDSLDSTANGHLEANESVTLTLALKMQESAGNEYQDLSIGSNFSVVLLATQYTSEDDSFDEFYDKDANFDFPSNSFSESVTENVDVADGKVAQDTTIQGTTTSAVIPAGVQVNDGINALTVSVSDLETSNANITLGENEAIRPLNVHVEGVSADNTVPMKIYIKEAAAKGLNAGNLKLYHVENGVSHPMTAVDTFTAHNQFQYDPATGDITLYMATFSEVTVVADIENAWNGAIAAGFAGGEGTSDDPWIIANADQLAYLNHTVSNGENASLGQYYRLVSDVNLTGSIWYPIGYWHPGEGANQAGEVWYTYGDAFQGVFDGTGHTITGLSQNTWTMDGNYDNGYYKEAMGLFGYVRGGTVRNLTIDSFSSEGEYAPTGCVAAYAADATFENIAVKGSHPQTYNTSVAAVVGRDGENGCSLTFRNITVDRSNTVSALWGSWDVGAAGLLGYLGPNSTAVLENCNVSATLDVYNDVCGNYQYYWYRYCGMLIGTVDKTLPDGSLDLSGITATGCTVNFGDRHEYYYCEFERNSQASYTDDYQFSRVPHSELDLTSTPVRCTHTHTDAEDKQAVYLPFYQLFGGYGWGVDGVDLTQYNGLQIEVDRQITVGPEDSTDKFLPMEDITVLESGRPYKLGQLFSPVDGADIHSDSVTLGITDLTPDNDTTVTFELNTDGDDWRHYTVTFTGADMVDITIQDYHYCNAAALAGVNIQNKITVTNQIHLLPDVTNLLPENSLASAPGVVFSTAPYAYTDTTVFAGKHITRIGIPVKSVKALDENQTFTLSVVKTTSNAYSYVNQYVLKLPVNQLGSSTTVNKWIYVDLDIQLSADETLAFGSPTDTVTWGYINKDNTSKYYFRSATSSSWSSPIKEAILFDVTATQSLTFEPTDQGLASISKTKPLPNVLTDFPESAIAGGNSVEFTNPPYAYTNQDLFSGKHIIRIGVPVKSALTMVEDPFFTLCVVKSSVAPPHIRWSASIS